MLPKDACPFPRPFPENFDGCPAYQPRTYVALDLRYKPLPPVWICQHLEVRSAGKSAQRYYGRCAIGDAAGRERWVQQVREARVQTLRRLSFEIGDITKPMLEELWAAKGRQLEARRSVQGDAKETAVLRRVAGRVRGRVNQFLRAHRAELEDAGLAYDASVTLVDVMLDRFVEQASSDEPPGIPPEVLAGFPEAVRIFFDPNQTAAGEAKPADQPPLAS